MDKIDLKKIKKVYIIGIEGAGTSALARICKNMGIEVSGSDEGDHFHFATLNKVGIKVNHEFRSGNIPKDADLIIYSTAFKSESNEELKGAFESGIKLISYSEALGLLFNEKMGIAVSGTHGKTTTSAMLADVLKHAGADPSAIIGSQVVGWGGGSLSGKSDVFVIEADEYQNKLQYYNPFGVILTSVDWDHPDYFPTFEEYKKVFADFVARIPKHGFLVACGESTSALGVAKSAKGDVLTYGFQEDCDFRIRNLEFLISNQVPISKFQKFSVDYKGEKLGEFEIQLVGKHNVLNAAAVVAVCHKLNIPMEKVRKGLKNFRGTVRRFQHIGEKNGAILIDDYAHHPEEIKATLQGARALYPEKNITTVFHPHTFTRTKALLQDFAQSFDNTDKVIIIDIYGSAREAQGGVSSEELANLINRYNPGKAEYVPTIPEVIEFLRDKIGSDDVVISMGAGNVWEVTDNLKEK